MNHVPGCDLTGLDIVKLAEGHGVEGRLVESVEDLDAALAWSCGENRPTLLYIRNA
jgi:benzoylformate decarboxylase